MHALRPGRCRTARRRSRRGRCRGRPAAPGPPAAPVPPSKGTSPARISRITTRAIASDLAQAAGEVLDQRVEHRRHDALAHRRGLAGDLGVGVDRAAAVVRAVKMTVAFAWPCPPASRDLTAITARWAAASCSVTSTVPVKVIDIAPIFTRISALHRVRTGRLDHPAALRRPGTTRSRSRIAVDSSRRSACRSRRGDRAPRPCVALLFAVIGSRPMPYRRLVSHRLGPDNATLLGQDRAHGRRRQGRPRPGASRSRPGRPRSSSAARRDRARRSTPTPRRCACARGPGASRRSATTTRRTSSTTIDDDVLKGTRRSSSARPTVHDADGTLERAGRADAGRHARARSRSTVTVGDDGALYRQRRRASRPTGA